jgi:putative Mg2+ transporter-C (MgtC) family protein
MPDVNSLSYGELLVRLVVAILAGALIGFDREVRRKPAGLRTMALVSLGSSVFVIASLDTAGASTDATSRVIQGIASGVGFLGAGSIIRIRDEESVRGLTTAASIWLGAGAGIASGMGNWPLVAAASLLGLLLLVITPVERVIHEKVNTDPDETRG